MTKASNSVRRFKLSYDCSTVPIFDARSEGLNLKAYRNLPPFTAYSELGNEKSVLVVFSVNCFAYDEEKMPAVSKKLTLSLSLNVLAVIVLGDKPQTSNFDNVERYRGDDDWRFIGVDISERDNEDGDNVSESGSYDEEGNERMTERDVFI